MILFCGEDAIGKLKITKTAENWLSGKFCAFGKFKKLKPLFQNLERAWLCETEDYFDFQDQSDKLNLTIEMPENRRRKISDFKIINGNFECKLR